MRVMSDYSIILHLDPITRFFMNNDCLHTVVKMSTNLDKIVFNDILRI